ncbi:MAG: fasciclin domain-containing protein [Bacteroidota bacterium]
MKKLNKLFPTMMLALIALGVVSCSSDDDAGQPIDGQPTTFEIIEESDDHTILAQLLVDTGLDAALDAGTYTVFAPNDSAFEGVNPDDFTQDELSNLLLNHVIEGNAGSSDLSNTYLETLATAEFSGSEVNLDMYVNVDDGVMLNGASSVITPDLVASNGTVHVVDEIVPIPNITTFVSADPEFETLLEAATRDDLTVDFVSLLSTENGVDPAPLTVFAPTNDAFQAALADIIELGFEITGLEDLPAVLLESAFTYHVVAGANVRSDGLVPTVETLGGELQIDVENSVIVDDNGREIQIEMVDVQTSNGVIHTIDNVILPELEVDPLPDLVEAATAAELNLLLDAIAEVDGLDQTLLDLDEVTVFAPTDDAFQNALDAFEVETLEDLVAAIGGVESLETVLGFHVITETYFSTDLQEGEQTVTTVAEQELTIDNQGGNVTLIDANGNTASVIQADVAIENGVVHVIDEVLLPEL